MTFNSVSYLILLTLAVVVFWILPERARRIFVFVASLLFYASWGLAFVWVPLFAAAVVFLVGRQIMKNPVGARRWMWLGIVLTLSLLIVFKYRGFLFSGLIVTGFTQSVSANSWLTKLAFPIGISFYTFEAVSYLIDLRQGRVKMPKFADLCLFFFFWPNVLSGPIVRARELMPQLGFRKVFEAQFVFDGLDRIVWGLVQKNVFADLLGIWVDKGFAPGAVKPMSSVDGWFLAVAFALQIYFDFAGYTNLAIGTARLLGVTLPENFRQPYHASTPVEFWARWHMTLSRWIRDYLFFPVNARWRGKPLGLYSSMILIMALVGLWHGAGWGFIVWGALHGIYLVLYRMYDDLKNERPWLMESRSARALWQVITLLAVVAAWVPFRAATLAKAGKILAAMFLHLRVGRAYSGMFYLLTVFAVLFCVVEPLLIQALQDWDEREDTQSISPVRVIVRPLLYALGLLLFLVFDTNNAQFIYSQF